jgi:hypothetical protein
MSSSAATIHHHQSTATAADAGDVSAAENYVVTNPSGLWWKTLYEIISSQHDDHQNLMMTVADFGIEIPTYKKKEWECKMILSLSVISSYVLEVKILPRRRRCRRSGHLHQQSVNSEVNNFYRYNCKRGLFTIQESTVEPSTHKY